MQSHTKAQLNAEDLDSLEEGCPNANPLAPLYRDFQVDASERILLTGHSHQAWPDCAKEGVLAAYQDAATHVDEKWERALQVAKRIKSEFARLMDDSSGAYVLGQNVHELALRCLSALPAYCQGQSLRAPILTTQGEFHSLRRQLDRFAEYGIEIQRVPHDLQLADHIIAALERKPKAHFGAIVLSAVGFLNGLIVPDLERIARAAREYQSPLIIDAYHALNVVPFSIQAQSLDDCFVLGGGYKYCQLGEGVCVLRIPTQRDFRPGLTGWFAEFELRDSLDPNASQLRYPKGAAAFAGSTYDPTSHYRAQAVLDFFDREQLTVNRLRKISQRQITRLREHFESLGLPADIISLADTVPDALRAGFLALRSNSAPKLCQSLRAQGVWTDARGEILRFGPAPYLNDSQLDAGMEALATAVKRLA